MKKLFFLILTTILPLMASADDSGTCGDNLTWTYVEATHTLTISGEGNMIDYIRQSNAPWYSYKDEMTKVIIEEGVASIGVRAFWRYSGLTSITIPNSVTSIGNYAFYGCSGLTSITIPNSVTNIGERVFDGCSGLTSAILNCKEIGNWFNGNTLIQEIIIGDEVTSIGNEAFSGCSGLTSITIPNSVTSIENRAFGGCSGLTYVTIPSSVTSIGNSAFSGCSSLTSITIPNSVTSIGYNAFSGCSGLTSITIGNNVTSIGAGAFEGTAWYDNQPEGLVYAGMVAYKYKGTMPDNTKIVLEEGTMGIGDNAFFDCDALISISIPNSVTSIGGYAFADCSGLTSIIIPNSVTGIGGHALDRCNNLVSISIGSGVKDIGFDAFQGCSNITTIHINDLASWCMVSFEDWEYGSTRYTSNPFDYGTIEHLYVNGEEITDLVIPDGVTKINSKAFYNLKSLTSVTIPNSVTKIGGSAFYGCDYIMTVNSEIMEPFNCKNAFSENTLRKGTLYVPAGTKELYTRFDGWREFLKIEEVGGEPEIYNLAFVVDNKELSAQNVEVGTAIAPPTKDGEGNTITWYTYLSTMPAHDLVVYGMVVKPTPEPAPTKYTLTYMLDGQQYKQLAIEEGATVAKETEPSKEGYSFSGWQNEPTTMPGRNVTVTGNFTINSYRLSFIAENRELSAKNLQYGSAITAPTADSEGNAIAWYTYPETMPAHDLVVYGMVVKQAEPEVFVWLTLKDGQGTTRIKVKQGAEQVLTITPDEGWKVVSVIMDGTDVTAQVGQDGSFTTSAIMQDATIVVVYEQEVPSEVAAARQSKADVKVVDDGVVISNAEADTRCAVYASNGQQVVSTMLDGGTRKITLPKGQVYVLTLGARTLKFAL
jgi:hypothetical protein